MEGEDWKLLKLIQKETQDGEIDDVVSKVAKALKSTLAKSIYSSEWLEIDSMLHFQGKIYVPVMGLYSPSSLAVCSNLLSLLSTFVSLRTAYVTLLIVDPPDVHFHIRYID